MLQRLKTCLRRLRDENAGSISIEAVVTFPLLA